MSDPMNSTSANKVPRRTFLQRLLLWATGIAGTVAGLIFAIPFVAYLLGPVRRDRVRWVNLGPVSKFPVGQTRLETFVNPLGQPWDGITATNGVFVRFLGTDSAGKESFRIFAVNCAHLGCAVEWFPQSALFLCPCHGGVYYDTGERASGPPPRGLYSCGWQIRKGNLEIQAPHYPTLQNTLKDEG
jgi:Rieske Fe-S protein